MDLSPTARVILGMLGLGPMSGYEIKQMVDSSTRFFWAASYGQIYPELRRLAEAGLIAGTEAAQGGRKRTVYELTAVGSDALREWLSAPPEVHETRDETMLKVFFSSFGGPQAVDAALRAKRDHHREIADRLRAIQATKEGDPRSSTLTTLRLGIAWNDFIADWCDNEAKERDR